MQSCNAINNKGYMMMEASMRRYQCLFGLDRAAVWLAVLWMAMIPSIVMAGSDGAGSAGSQGQGPSVADPLEPVNRAIFTFNRYADRYVLKPVAQGYDVVVPDAGKTAVNNVLRNLDMPLIFVNSILQGDPENAFSSFWTFMLNSTFGFAGLYDFAGNNTDLTVRREDFGQSLGKWGVGTGPYLVLPLMGPSNLRDTAGMFADIFADPVNMTVDEDAFTVARIALTAINQRYQALGTIEDVYETSLDPYATFRSGFAQRREALVDNRN